MHRTDPGEGHDSHTTTTAEYVRSIQDTKTMRESNNIS
jgi:hypothetical protein